jgi:hypothetical protein
MVDATVTNTEKQQQQVCRGRRTLLHTGATCSAQDHDSSWQQHRYQQCGFCVFLRKGLKLLAGVLVNPNLICSCSMKAVVTANLLLS